jgi:hypothetical protein
MYLLDDLLLLSFYSSSVTILTDMPNMYLSCIVCVFSLILYCISILYNFNGI